jgi:acylphosphatase
MNPEAEGERQKYRIVGTVQQVGYRDWLQSEARRRTVRGWVRNECDGAVVTLLLGNADSVGEVAGILRIGPAAANVLDATSLHLEPEDESWDKDTFEIRT